MENQLNAAAAIAASLLSKSTNPNAEEIASVLERAMEGVQIAVGRQNAKNTQKHAALKMHKIPGRLR
jgi:hypothetical protein